MFHLKEPLVQSRWCAGKHFKCDSFTYSAFKKDSIAYSAHRLRALGSVSFFTGDKALAAIVYASGECATIRNMGTSRQPLKILPLDVPIHRHFFAKYICKDNVKYEILTRLAPCQITSCLNMRLFMLPFRKCFKEPCGAPTKPINWVNQRFGKGGHHLQKKGPRGVVQRDALKPIQRRAFEHSQKLGNRNCSHLEGALKRPPLKDTLKGKSFEEFA